MGKPGNGKGGSKGCSSLLAQYTEKDLKALGEKHQVKNLSGLLKTLNSLGVRFQEKVKGKGKAKGHSDPGGLQGKGPQACPHPKSKPGAKTQGGHQLRNDQRSVQDKAGGRGGAGSSSQLPAGNARPTILVKGTQDAVATMLDQNMQER